MQDQSNPPNESDPPVSEVVVLAKNAGEEETHYALKPDRGDGRTIVSKDESCPWDEVTLNTVSDESDKGLTLSAQLSRATATSDVSTRASTASRLIIPSTSTQVLQSKIDKMTDEERQAARNTASALMRTLETKVAVKSLHRDVTENHQEVSIDSNDDVTLNDESVKGSTLGAALDNTRSSSSLLTRYNLTYTGREIREELDNMTDEQIATKRKMTQLTLQSLGIDRKISGMRSEMTENHQEAMTEQRGILQRPAASRRTSTASRLIIPSTSTQVLQSKIDKMTDEERQAARNTASALMRTLETKVAVKSLHRDVTENHQEAMTGQREILKQHGELKTKMDEQPNDVADAVIERLAPILSRVMDRRRCEDSTPARGEGHRRTSTAASRSSRRSEKRSRPPRSAVMSSKKAARIHGFDSHVRDG